MQHISLSRVFKFISESTKIFCKFNIKFFDNMWKFYRADGLLYDRQQFYRNVAMGMAQTPNKPKSIEST